MTRATRNLRLDLLLYIAVVLIVILAVCTGGCTIKGFEDDGPDPIEQTETPTTRPIGMSGDGHFDTREALHDPRVDQAVTVVGFGGAAGAVLLLARLFFPRKRRKGDDGPVYDPNMPPPAG